MNQPDTRQPCLGSGLFAGQKSASVRKDVCWFTPAGEELTDRDWFDDSRRSLGMLLDGGEIPDRSYRGEPITGDSLLILLHAADADTTWTLPSGRGERWEVVLDTARPAEEPGARTLGAGERLAAEGHSVVVLRCPR